MCQGLLEAGDSAVSKVDQVPALLELMFSLGRQMIHINIGETVGGELL